MPGEKARPHRHTMNALRFVLEGKGAATIVDGKSCPMEEGDLIITPGWTWHEHVHQGNAPIIWLDALDAPLHRYLGTDVFEPGPAHDMPDYADDAAFAAPTSCRKWARASGPISPVFRYPWAAAASGVRAAPNWKDGSRRVRYINPLTGGPTMPLMDCYLDPDRQGHRDHPLPHHQQCGVRGGRRQRQKRCRRATPSTWKQDIFSLPHGNWITHQAEETAPCSWSPIVTRCVASISQGAVR